nr:helix-turn-helix transcriptional regulator [Sphingomonas sp. G-3-2-10]
MSRKRRSVADEPFLLVRSQASDHRAGEAIAPHVHDWHQLIFAASGVMRVWTERGSWVAPPSWAIWVPGGVRHGIGFAGASLLRTLYLEPGWAGDVPGDCAVASVSPLLRELVLRTVEIGMLDGRDAHEAALALLIRGEIAQRGVPPFDLPQPQSPALRAAAERARGDAPPGLIAEEAGMSLRVLERRFLAETGLSLGRWRRQARLLAAMEQLAAGASVKRVAASAGYATPSAFVAAFRSAFGETPGRYFQRA